MQTLLQRVCELEDGLKTLDSRFLKIERQLQLTGNEFGIWPSETSPSETELRLFCELQLQSFSFGRFLRVPRDYYDRDLVYRRDCLGARSTLQLCKTMVMENTKRMEDSLETNAKYIMVILQYEKDRVHGEKLQSFLYNLNQKKIPRKCFNLRLAAEEVSTELTGFEHNSVTPIGSKTSMPIIISHEITLLEEGTFYIGAGEVDLKLQLKIEEFVSKYNAFVVNCTY